MDNPKLKLDPKQQALDSATSADDFLEPTKEEILEDIRSGIIQAKAGLGRPALESIEELRREIYGDAIHSCASSCQGD